VIKIDIYVCHAYRWGDKNLHSYSVGVYLKKQDALKAAEKEEDFRGGKYKCEIIKWTIGDETLHKVVRPITNN